jgi:integrase
LIALLPVWRILLAICFEHGAQQVPNIKAKIGLREIAAQPPGPFLIWDREVRGFCARRQLSETITYSVVFRTQEGTQRWMKIGRHPILTPHLARQRAIEVLRDVTLGKDPAGERHALRNALTVSELCDEYSAKVNGKKQTTINSDRSRINLHIKPKLGKYRVISVTSDMVETFMHSMSAASGKRTVGLLGAIFTWAVKRKIVAVNPVSAVEKPRDTKRTRRLSNEEYQQLWQAILGAAKPIASVITMLAISGWRFGEVRFLKWAELDLPRQVATLTDTKSGMSVRPLSMEAVKIIEAQQKRGPYVFELNGEPIKSFSHRWKRLDMPSDVSPHTLRHSFASLAADLGFSDHIIAGLLGHSRSSITSRYIHIERSLVEAADRVSLETLRLMNA